MVASSDTGLPSADPYTAAIRTELIKIAYRHLRPLFTLNLLVAAAVVYALWSVTSHARLIAWFVAVVIVVALRTALYLAFHRVSSDPMHPFWRAAFTLGSGAAGLMWGIAGGWLYPAGLLEYQLFLAVVLIGMGAGAVSSLTAYMPAFYAFVPISFAPIIVTVFRSGDAIHFALGALGVFYVAGVSFFAHTIHRSLVESLGLRFQNIELVKQLSEQRDEAERANVAKSKFLAAASHDLRQPLHALTLFTSALDERIRYPEARRIVDSMSASVRALEKLFNALLDISRLDAGVLQSEVRDFRLSDLLTRLVNEYAPEAEAKQLSLVCEPCDAVVRSDPALLERILRNYVSNAIRYTEDGGVRIAFRGSGGELRIDVVDTGIGIPSEYHRDIFNEFQQLGNPERDRTKGLGLGLAIVERVARMLDHPIEIRSAPEKGSCFSVTVPLGDAIRISHESEKKGGISNDSVGLRVVVVDDEVGAREGARTLLEQWGCEVLVAGSEDEAMAGIGTRAPDAIIVDYRLRENRTGVQVIDRLRDAFGVAIPALIVTGDTAPERLREAKASGHPLVHKPVQPAVLRAFLGRVRHAAPTEVH